MTLDYSPCTINGRPFVELFDAETGDSIAFRPAGMPAFADYIGRAMLADYAAGELTPNALILARP